MIYCAGELTIITLIKKKKRKFMNIPFTERKEDSLTHRILYWENHDKVKKNILSTQRTENGLKCY